MSWYTVIIDYHIVLLFDSSFILAGIGWIQSRNIEKHVDLFGIIGKVLEAAEKEKE